jgi:hypothetical protein
MIITEIPKSWARLDRIKTLEAELAAMTAERDDLAARLALESAGYRAAANQRNSAEMAVKAMTAAKELAERQVAVLAKLASKRPCARCPALSSCDIRVAPCDENMAAWSRAEAERGKE